MSFDGQRARIPQNYRGRPSFTSVSRTRESTPTILSLCKIHQGVEYFELNRSRLESLPATKNHQGLGDSKDESDANIFLSLTLKPASNHLHISSSNWCEGSHSKGTLIEFLSRISLTTSVTWQSKFSAVFLQLLCASAQLHCKPLLDDSNLNAFQTFWPRLNIFRLVDVP